MLRDNPDELYKAAEQAEKAVSYIKDHMLEKGKLVDMAESKGQVVGEETEEYKYYLDRRPISIGTVPKGFSRFDEDDMGARYGAVYYKGKLTDKQIADYELIPAYEKQVENKAAISNQAAIDPKKRLLMEMEKTEAKSMAKGA